MAVDLDRSASAGYYNPTVIGSNITFTTWFWPRQTQHGPNSTYILFCHGNNSTAQLYYRGGLAGGSGYVGCRNYSGTAAYYTTNTINDQTSDWITPGPSNWHHISITFSGNNVWRVWLDGGTRASGGTARTTTRNNTSIGFHYYSGVRAGPFDGYLAEAGLYNTQLTEDKHDLLARGFSPLAIQPANLIAYWPFVRGNSASAMDRITPYNIPGYGDPQAVRHASILHTVPQHFYHISKPVYAADTQHLMTLTPKMATPVSSNYATLGLRNRHPVLKFDDTTVQEATFDSVMPQQFPGSMALTVKMVTSAETASAGSAVLGAAFERISGSLQDVDNDGFGGFVKGSVGTPVTSGETSIVTLKYKTGNQVKRLQPGDKFRLRVQRAATAGGDILDGNLELHSVEIRY